MVGLAEIDFIRGRIEMKSFYNTNAETGDQLKRSCISAMSQQDQILSYFKAHPGRYYIPSEIQRTFPQMLLTSIRRAMCNLTPDYLVKTELRSMGAYGKDNFNWRLQTNGRHEQQKLF